MSEVDLETLALYHIRAALVTLLGNWTFALAVAHNDPGYFGASDATDEHYRSIQRLQTEHLCGTRFEGAALWSLFIITATATSSLWTPRSIGLLARLMRSPKLGIRTFADLEQLLCQYVYSRPLHAGLCQALFVKATQNLDPDTVIGQRFLRLKISDLRE
jgi:hypothetical protein